MKIYAHRGASATHPENTLPAFAEAIRLGADGVELDVHATSDGVPVVLHDRSLARTAGIDANVDEMSFAGLRRDAPQIPTLNEVFALVGDSLHFDLEIKQSGIAEKVLDVIAQHGSIRWAVSSFDWDVVRSFQVLEPYCTRWLLGMTFDQQMIATSRETGATGVALYDGSVSAEIAHQVHEHGLSLMVWTVNNPARAKALDSWGVDMLCTDDPGALMPAPV